MERAGDIILDALKEIVVLPAESAIDAYKAQVGLFYLNAMMLDLSASGVDIGFTLVDSLSDEITVDDAALEGMVKNLALEISPTFKNSTISQDLFMQARDGLNVMRQIAYEQPAYSSFSQNLPIGSGNEFWDITKFYTEGLDPILTEISGSIAPEVPSEG